MPLRITNPAGITKTIETYGASDLEYFAKWREQGYIVEEVPKVTIYTGESVCTACEG